MAHVYAWHGEFDRSTQQAEAAVAMSPYDAELRSLAFSSPMPETLMKLLNGAYGRLRATNK